MYAGVIVLVLTLFTTSAISADKQAVSRYLSPQSIRPALGAYSHGVETVGAKRWVHVAGQTGIRKDGSIPDDFETQARVAMDNVKAILAEANMSWDDVVSFRLFMTDRDDLEVWKKLGNELFGKARPAGTLVFVAGLVHPKWRIEIEATAAK